MLFLLKKWIGGLLMPLPLFLMVFFIALILLLFTQKQKVAKILLIGSFMFIFLLSYMPVSEKIVSSLERKHQPIMQVDIAQNFDYILLLGSGGIADPALPVTGQLSAVALSRFMEVLRLYHANPNATIVVSGGAFGDIKTHAQLAEQLALSMGIPAQQIMRLDNTLDTDDEAREMSNIIRNKKAVLVTSATHMDRSLTLFYKYGGRPIPAPAHFLAKKRMGKTPLPYYIPNSYYLTKTKVAWHEYLGRLQTYLKSLF